MAMTMYAGESRTVLIVAKMPDGVTPLPLAGRTMTLMLKKFRGLPDAGSLTKTSHGLPGGITFTDAPNGLASATIDPPDTVGFVGVYLIGLKVWPGSLEISEDTITIIDPVVETVTAP